MATQFELDTIAAEMNKALRKEKRPLLSHVTAIPGGYLLGVLDDGAAWGCDIPTILESVAAMLQSAEAELLSKHANRSLLDITLRVRANGVYVPLTAGMSKEAIREVFFAQLMAGKENIVNANLVDEKLAATVQQLELDARKLGEFNVQQRLVWVRDLALVNEYKAGRVRDPKALISHLEALGYKREDHVGGFVDTFPKRVRWIFGQVLDALYANEPIHPIIATFVDRLTSNNSGRVSHGQ